jgi:hypothetical protein
MGGKKRHFQENVTLISNVRMIKFMADSNLLSNFNHTKKLAAHSTNFCDERKKKIIYWALFNKRNHF